MSHNEYGKKYAERNIGLDAAGIGHDIESQLAAGAEKITAVLAAMSTRMHQQMNYDLLTNVPCGVMQHDEVCDAKHAIRVGIVMAAGCLVGYDIYDARRLCAQILEDVNDSHGAAMMFEQAEKGEDKADPDFELAEGKDEGNKDDDDPFFEPAKPAGSVCGQPCAES
jgi:hypothetical protein